MAPRIATRGVETSAQVHYSYSGRCMDHEESSSDEEEDVHALRRQAKEASDQILHAGKAHGAIVRRKQARGPLTNLVILQQALEALEDIVSQPSDQSLAQKRLPTEVMDTAAQISRPAAAFAPDRPATTPTKPAQSKSVVSRLVRRQSSKASSSFADMCALEARTHRNSVTSAEEPVLRAQMAVPPSIGQTPHEPPKKKSHSMSKQSPRVSKDAKHARRASANVGTSESLQTALCFHMAEGDESQLKVARESSLTRGYQALDAKHFAFEDDSDTDSGIKSNIASVYDALASPQLRLPKNPTSPKGYTLPPLTPQSGRRSGKHSRTTSPSMLSAMEIDLCSSQNIGNNLGCSQSSSLDHGPVPFPTEHNRQSRSCGSFHSSKVVAKRETNITLPALPTSKAKQGISFSSISGLKLRTGSVEPSLWSVSPSRNALEYDARQLVF